MVFIEAAACGKPSLAGEAGGTGSAVLHEVSGLRVDGCSLEAVSDGLRRLVQDAALRASLGTAGLVRVGADFNWDAVASKSRGVNT